MTKVNQERYTEKLLSSTLVDGLYTSLALTRGYAKHKVDGIGFLLQIKILNGFNMMVNLNFS